MEYDGVSCLSPSQSLGPASIEVETGNLLHGLVRRNKPLCVVQTGTHWGFSSAWIACALEENHRDYPHFGKPRLYTWDGNDYEGRADALLHQLGVREYVELIIGDSRTNEEPHRGIDSATLPPIDFMFLDADHGTDAVMEEWERFSPQLAPGALVGFHDTTLDPREAEAVRIIEEQTGWPVIRMRNLRGFDLIQKPY
jgi:predicted O-methyltransferase YrrM